MKRFEARVSKLETKHIKPGLVFISAMNGTITSGTFEGESVNAVADDANSYYVMNTIKDR